MKNSLVTLFPKCHKESTTSSVIFIKCHPVVGKKTYKINKARGWSSEHQKQSKYRLIPCRYSLYLTFLTDYIFMKHVHLVLKVYHYYN